MMKKTIAICVVITVFSILVSGCGAKKTGSSEIPELTYWLPPVDHVSYSYKNFGDTELAKELKKRTGIKVTYLHPTKGQEKEQFNLMIASKDLPDIIRQTTSGYKGGPAQAIQDQILISLNKYINDQNAPNISKIIKKDKDVDRAMQLDDKTYYAFPFIVDDAFLQTYKGLIVRQDWLDKLNLAVPETGDEWETALTGFKETIGASAPFTFLGTNNFADAFGTPRGYYYDVNKKGITFGFYEKNYKKYVELMRRWYEKGLLDREFATQSTVMADAKITNGDSGLFITTVGGGMGKYITAMADNSDVKWAGAPYPVENKGDSPLYGQKTPKATPMYSITSMCKNPELAVKFLDYGYSEEGHMLYNFGIEGISYDMVDGYPKYTKQITDNENNVPMIYEMCKYMASAYSGPFEQDRRYFEQYLKNDEQKQAIERWMQPANSNELPAILLTKEENEIIATMVTDIQNYWVEGEYKFIMGKLPMEQYDEYVDKLNNMGINKILEVYNAAYKRLISR